MNVGILADSHDNVRKIRKALYVFREREVRAVLHAGDLVAPFAAKALKGFPGPLHAVFGNNDGERDGLARLLDIAPPPREISLGGRRIVLAHELREIPDDLAARADVVIAAHTHEVSIAPGLPLRLDPGEAGGWLTGRSTCVVLDLEKMEARVCELGGP